MGALSVRAESEEQPTRSRSDFAWVAGCGFLAAAVAAALLAADELRAGNVADALSLAEGAATPERREAALSKADASLAAGAPTGELRELAAALALLSDPPDLDLAERRTWDALSRSPARAEAWARLAYIDVVRNGRLGPDGLAALARSYEAAPFGSTPLRHWRVEFTLSRWSEVSPEIRAAALREAHAATSGGARWWEETLWMRDLAERLPAPAKDELLMNISSGD